jgi:hypothetical protein
MHLFFLYFKWGQVVYSSSVCVCFVFDDFQCSKWRLCRITSRNPSRQLTTRPGTEIEREVQSIPLLHFTYCHFNFSAVTFCIYLDCPLNWHSFDTARLLYVPTVTITFLPIGLLHVFMFIMTSANIIFLLVRKVL